MGWRHQQLWAYGGRRGWYLVDLYALLMPSAYPWISHRQLSLGTRIGGGETERKRGKKIWEYEVQNLSKRSRNCFRWKQWQNNQKIPKMYYLLWPVTYTRDRKLPRSQLGLRILWPFKTSHKGILLQAQKGCLGSRLHLLQKWLNKAGGILEDEGLANFTD